MTILYLLVGLLVALFKRAMGEKMELGWWLIYIVGWPAVLVYELLDIKF